MIHELRLAGLGVIAEAACEFAPGFTAVTGETGAGKTMVVTGLGLLAGARSDPGLVRPDATQAEVEGRFDAPPEPVAMLIAEAGGALDEEGLTGNTILIWPDLSPLKSRLTMTNS